MSSIDNEILLGAEEDAKEVAYIRSYVGPDVADKLDEDDLYYVIDVFCEYMETQFKAEPDADGFVDIDVDDIAKYVAKKAKKEGMGPYEMDDLNLIINAELEYNETLED